MATLTAERIEEVALRARPYPTHLLEGCETGLCLFAAAFLGHNDSIHFAERGIVTTCVDRDPEQLRRMEALYPDEWCFFCDDAWEFAERWTGSLTWDVVSVDTFTGDAEERSLKSLDLWCSLAAKVVSVTVTAGKAYHVPAGWRSSLYPRSDLVYWLVLERD